MNKAIFYHAGCPVCISAEQAGVQSVPALLIEGNVFHINYGASLDDVKGGE